MTRLWLCRRGCTRQARAATRRHTCYIAVCELWLAPARRVALPHMLRAHGRPAHPELRRPSLAGNLLPPPPAYDHPEPWRDTLGQSPQPTAPCLPGHAPRFKTPEVLPAATRQRVLGISTCVWPQPVCGRTVRKCVRRCCRV